MPEQQWSAKRERQYEHIKESQQDRGTGEGRAKEIAARGIGVERVLIIGSGDIARTVMSAILVVAILGVFEPQIKDAITRAIDSVSNSK